MPIRWWALALSGSSSIQALRCFWAVSHCLRASATAALPALQRMSKSRFRFGFSVNSAASRVACWNSMSASVIRRSWKARSPSIRNGSGSLANLTTQSSSSPRAGPSWFTLSHSIAIITPGGGILALLFLTRSRIARQPSMSRSRKRLMAPVTSWFWESSETALPIRVWAVTWAAAGRAATTPARHAAAAQSPVMPPWNRSPRAICSSPV
ncbi:MAG: hypothetical protein EBZ74_07405 [Planctomycetia bacterium]|nr:hypothetical protein [Planctomycetia bacterium]